MSYVPTKETVNLPHVVEDIDGNIRAMTYNREMAEFFARKLRRHVAVVTTRPANEDDVASFNRRLGDC